MISKIIAGSLFAAVLFVGIPASAATISNPLFSNGDTTIDAKGGSTVSGTYTIEVGQTEVCEVLRTQADASQPVKDTNVGGTKGYEWGTHTNVPFSVVVPPNTGTYFPTVQCAGKFGGNHSVDGADNVVAGPTNLGTITVTAGSADNSNPFPGGTGTTMDDEFWNKMAILIAAAMKANTPSTPPVTKPAFCAPLASATNTFAIQSVLVSAGYMTQAQVNTGPGIMGPKTSAALMLAQNACK